MGKIKQFCKEHYYLLCSLYVLLAPLSALAQTIQLTGTVTEPRKSLIGASIWRKEPAMVASPTLTATLR